MDRKRIAAALLAAALLASCGRTAPDDRGQPEVAQPVPEAAPPPAPRPAVERIVRSAPVATSAPPPVARDGPAAPSSSANYALVRVFYGTNRSPLSVPGPEGRFGTLPGPLSYGEVVVSVPKVHQLGVIERPGMITGLFFSPDPRKHFTLREIRGLSRAQLLQAVAAQAERAGGPGQRLALVFVHGFNVGFDDAAFRTAQMSYDIGFKGAPLFYSWPSHQNVLSYLADGQRIDQSRPLIKRFLSEVIVGSRADRVIIVAHSMGTRGTVAALAELSQEHPEQTARIAALILAAPDIQARNFRDRIAPRLRRMAVATTLYASSEDVALQASYQVNGAYALGDTRAGISRFEGMDSIDATRAGTSFLGHSAYGESPALLRDIGSIVAGTPPARRPWLRRGADGAWVLEVVR
ncbi:MAG TPA: alpha/beta hydrolase [Allosphingosinicella sp.]|nr:alpha/beta hydrolase [Allosphingosinicella sp.]